MNLDVYGIALPSFTTNVNKPSPPIRARAKSMKREMMKEGIREESEEDETDIKNDMCTHLQSKPPVKGDQCIRIQASVFIIASLLIEIVPSRFEHTGIPTDKTCMGICTRVMREG